MFGRESHSGDVRTESCPAARSPEEEREGKRRVK